MTLHVLTEASQNTALRISDTVTAQDEILLIQDGCFMAAFFAGSERKAGSIYILEADAAQRGIQVQNGICIITHDEWVTLTEKHNACATW